MNERLEDEIIREYEMHKRAYKMLKNMRYGLVQKHTAKMDYIQQQIDEQLEKMDKAIKKMEELKNEE